MEIKEMRLFLSMAEEKNLPRRFPVCKTGLL